MPVLSPTVQMHLLVFIFAVTGVLGHWLTLSATSLVAWRTFLAMIVMGLWIMVRKKASIWISPKLVMQLIGTGLIVGSHWVMFYASIKVANLSICLAGMASISLFTAFTDPIINRSKISKNEVLLGGLVACGLALIAGVEKTHLLGLAIAIGGGFLAAIFPVINRKFILTGLPADTIFCWEMLGACLAALLFHPFFFRYTTLVEWRGLDWLWMGILVLLCTVFAIAYHIRLLSKLTAYASNLAMNFEPVYGIIFGAILFHDYQSLQPTFYLGAFTIFLANFLHLRRP